MSDSNVKELLHALFAHGSWLGLYTIAFVLALVLPRLRARGWLIAATTVWLVVNLWEGTGQVVRILGSQETFRDIWAWAWPFSGLVGTTGWACLIFFLYGQRTAANDRLSAGEILFPLRGRIARRHFWLASVAIGLPGWMPFSWLFYSYSDTKVVALVSYGLWLLLSLWPSLALQVKRWHDRNRSGWMVLVNLIPIVGPIWAFIEIGCLPGTPGPNDYGDDPLAVQPLPPPAPPAG